MLELRLIFTKWNRHFHCIYHVATTGTQIKIKRSTLCCNEGMNLPRIRRSRECIMMSVRIFLPGSDPGKKTAWSVSVSDNPIVACDPLLSSYTIHSTSGSTVNVKTSLRPVYFTASAILS